MSFALFDLLAQLPESNVYVSPMKLALLLVLTLFWVKFAEWVDKDTLAVNTFQVLWNLVVVSTGVIGLALLILVPNFWIGMSLFLGLYFGTLITYVLHRNKLVKEDDRVFTPAHIGRLMKEGFKSKKKQAKEVKERVKLNGADRKPVPIPAEDPEREHYRLAQDLMFDVLWRRASVVEVSPAGQASKVSYQIDGIPTERDNMLRPEADAMVMFFKKIAGLNLEEHRKPQSNKIMAAIGENKYEVVVKTDGSTAGEKLSLRIIGAERNFKLPDLGFTPKQLETMWNVLREIPKGLVLLSGPRGSGLTTTVYSVARSHDAFLNNLQTLEYVKEMPLDNITQHVFSGEGDKTFTNDLERVIRTDPDIIIVPEIREKAAAMLACEAAAKKQKIHTSLEATDIFDALKKWLALVGDTQLVAKSLLAVTNQRLIRVLCTACKQPYTPPPEMMRKINLPPDKVLHRPPEPQVDKHGNPIICQNCQGSGYVGRTGIFEVLLVDDGVRDLLRKGGSLADVQSFAIKQGGLGLQQQALQKALDGVTSIQEIARVTRGGAAKPTDSASAAKPRPSGPATPAAK